MQDHTTRITTKTSESDSVLQNGGHPLLHRKLMLSTMTIRPLFLFKRVIEIVHLSYDFV